MHLDYSGTRAKISHIELALIAEDVYEDVPRKQKLLLNAPRVLPSSIPDYKFQDPNGDTITKGKDWIATSFFARLYNVNGSKVIAFRGTEKEEKKDWMMDAKFALAGNPMKAVTLAASTSLGLAGSMATGWLSEGLENALINSQIGSAMRTCAAVLGIPIDSKHEYIRKISLEGIYLTGHSLGGILAKIMGGLFGAEGVTSYNACGVGTVIPILERRLQISARPPRQGVQALILNLDLVGSYGEEAPKTKVMRLFVESCRNQDELAKLIQWAKKNPFIEFFTSMGSQVAKSSTCLVSGGIFYHGIEGVAQLLIDLSIFQQTLKNSIQHKQDIMFDTEKILKVTPLNYNTDWSMIGFQ